MKILSFDIGSYSVKAVELDVSFGRVELADYLVERVVESQLAQEAPASAEEPPHGAGAAKTTPRARPRKLLTEGQLAAIRRILSDRQFKYDRLAVNFPRAWVTTRIFTFPTKDRKTIQNSLNFELDDEIPFGMGDIVHDFTVLNTTGAASTVFTAVALKSDVTVLLSELQMLGLDPDLVTVECWSMSQLINRAIPKEYEGRPVCIVNIGHRQTYVHMHVGNGPLLTHVSSCAGDDVTRAIAEAYNLTYDQAEKAKIDGAFVLTGLHGSQDAPKRQDDTSPATPVTEEQKAFADTVSKSLAPMIREIKQTLMSYKSQYKLTPRAVFVTGGSSLILNLPLYLEEQLKLPVFPLSYMSRIVGQTLQLSETSEAVIPTATGLGLASIKLDRNATVNLRRDVFAKKGGLGAFNVEAFKKPLKIVAASLAFVYLNLIIQGGILSARSQGQDERLERAIKSVVGAVNPSVMNTYKNSPSTLKSAVNRELAKYKNTPVAPVQPSTSALDILNKVSAAVPRDVTLDVTLFEVKDGRLQLTGVVDQPTAPDRIAQALQETKLLTEVTKGKVAQDPKTKKTTFELTAKVAEAGNVKNR